MPTALGSVLAGCFLERLSVPSILTQRNTQSCRKCRLQDQFKKQTVRNVYSKKKNQVLLYYMYEKMLGNCSSFPCLQSSVQRHPFQSTLAATLLEKSCFVADVGNRYLNLREQGVKRWTIALISLPSVFCYFFLIKTQPT